MLWNSSNLIKLHFKKCSTDDCKYNPNCDCFDSCICIQRYTEIIKVPSTIAASKIRQNLKTEDYVIIDFHRLVLCLCGNLSFIFCLRFDYN